jgi:periplasmic protein TonB
MPRNEFGSDGWAELAFEDNLSLVGQLAGAPGRRWSPLFWVLSCGIHVMLLAAVGVLTRDISDVPPPIPLRVSIVTSGEPSAPPALAEEASPVPQSHQPERRSLTADPLAQTLPVYPDPAPLAPPPEPLALPTPPERAPDPVVPETPMPELIEVLPEAQSARPPMPLVQPTRPVSPSPLSPEVTPPPAPSPPVSTPPTRPRPPQTAPAREVPKRTAPPTTFNDALIARVPPSAPKSQDRGASPAPTTGAAERMPPPASLPQASGVRYGQNPGPAYPSEARRRGWEGTVLLLVEIRENGRPDRITVKQSSGHSVLDEAAKGAVGRWTFIPAQRDGRTLRSLAEVPIVFSLRNGR